MKIIIIIISRIIASLTIMSLKRSLCLCVEEEVKVKVIGVIQLVSLLPPSVAISSAVTSVAGCRGLCLSV